MPRALAATRLRATLLLTSILLVAGLPFADAVLFHLGDVPAHAVRAESDGVRTHGDTCVLARELVGTQLPVDASSVRAIPLADAHRAGPPPAVAVPIGGLPPQLHSRAPPLRIA